MRRMYRVSADTRAIELMSAASLLLTGIACVVSDAIWFPAWQLSIQPAVFWTTIMLVFGGLQSIALGMVGNVTMMRGILSWAIGSHLVWWALELVTNHHVGLAEIAVFVLGITNIYAFIINTVITLSGGGR